MTKVHLILSGTRELISHCCTDGAALYEAWLDEIDHACDRAHNHDGSPWNSRLIHAAMLAYFIHRNGRWSTKLHRWEVEPCRECHYGEES